MAKDQGFRSRASFKLIQLNKKFNFLANARVVIDLCAAPGSWLQVCSKYMPVSRLLIGVDLDKIKPIPNAVTFVADITTPQCRNELTKLTEGFPADVILHDGAPNVGGAWAQDAYSQSELVLSATKLATVFLAPGGTFVTKVFRSADYNSLLWVFNTLFKKVTATKPSASRGTSAEIFVVCEGYLKPESLDPRLLDPKYVFEEIKTEKKKDIFSKKQAKRNREGYDTESSVLHKSCDVLDFIYCFDPVAILSDYNNIVFGPCPPVPDVERERDVEDDEEERSLYHTHPRTTDEIKECLKDLKVLGKKDFRGLLRWRVLMRDFASLNPKKEPQEKEEIELTEEQKENLLQQEMEDKINQMARLKKKKLAKRKKLQQKFLMRTGLRGDTGDVEGFEAPTDLELFDLSSVKNKDTLDNLTGSDLVNLINESNMNEGIYFGETDSTELKLMEENYAMLENDTMPNEHDESYDQGESDEDGNEDDEDDDEVDVEKRRRDRQVEKYLDIMYERFLAERNRLAKTSKKDLIRSLKEETKAVDLHDYTLYNQVQDDKDLDETAEDVLVTSHKDPANVQASMWFGDKLFEDLEAEEDEDKALQAMLDLSRKRKRNEDLVGPETASNDTTKKRKTESKTEEDGKAQMVGEGEVEGEAMDVKEDDDDKSEGKANESIDSDSEYDYGEADFEVVSRGTDPDDYDSDEQAEILAFGKALKDPTRRASIIDRAFNRYSFAEDVDTLPRWFVEDEAQHNRAQKPISKQEVLEYKQMLKGIDARNSKRVVEAKARKKKRYIAKLEKAKSKAKIISDSTDMSEREKIKAIQKLYKGQLSRAKKEKVYVVARKFSSARVKGTGGSNVQVKVVDPRMKKDKRAEKAKERRSGKTRNGRKGRKGGKKGGK
eukprot:TRINITY_DN5627_c0_g1_i10.p1 TRINITY_DN5627_c0_g1~~TRINITY_DN5627_c0_g1_i10.p1  ORF type:complete len:890 (-),score=254.32 TRINITY_DN5627_c0_g1_i10:305-2974(-)